MDTQKVISELSQKYPGKKIIRHPEENPTEIICEIDPASEHPEKSVAIAVVDRSESHYHKESREVYEILKGELPLNKDGKDYKLTRWNRLTILPGEIRFTIGKEVWVKVCSEPGWAPEDHILVKNN